MNHGLRFICSSSGYGGCHCEPSGRDGGYFEGSCDYFPPIIFELCCYFSYFLRVNNCFFGSDFFVKFVITFNLQPVFYFFVLTLSCTRLISITLVS